MPIIYSCKCGETIEFPDEMAGRLATCQSCNAIFTVPRPATEEEPDELNKLFEEPAGDTEELLIDLLVPAPDPPPLAPPPIKAEDDLDDPDEDEQDGRDEDEQDEEDGFPEAGSFWGDLAEAFEFIVHGRSLMTFILLTLLVYLGSFLFCVPLFGFVVMFLLNGYLCAYCLSVIVQSAMGEDELPGLLFDNV